MVCVDIDYDEDFGSMWKCECGDWNLDADDECQSCWKYWE